MLMKVMYALLVLVPAAIILDVADFGGHSLTFVVSGLAMVPLAHCWVARRRKRRITQAPALAVF